jgi:hypothetical protein
MARGTLCRSEGQRTTAISDARTFLHLGKNEGKNVPCTPHKNQSRMIKANQPFEINIGIYLTTLERDRFLEVNKVLTVKDKINNLIILKL